MRRALVPVSLVLGVCAGGAPARADGIVIVGGSPRAIGRAGAGTVGDDGGGALLVNPAGLARRDATRVQVGTALVDDGVTWTPARADAPVARSQAGSSVLPLVAVIGAVGPWVIGGAVMTAAASARALRDPLDVPAASELGAAFEYRYAGTAGRLRRDTVTLGVARRLGEAVAVGVAVGASRVQLAETRRLWAGFAGITPVGDPRSDVQVALAGEDGFVPSATAGVLLAPAGTPLELALSLGWTARTAIDGDLAAVGTNDGPRVDLVSPRAHLAFRQPLAVRGGVRYLGDRFALEIDGDLWIPPTSARTAAWRVTGVQIIDPSSLAVDLEVVPSRLSQRMQAALRGALDVELIGGLLWGTAGYAYAAGGTTARRLSPSLGDLGGHTLAVGIEGSTGGFTVTLGWSRTLSRARTGGADLALDNPFGAGDGPVPEGTSDGAVDQVGVLLDVEL